MSTLHLVSCVVVNMDLAFYTGTSIVGLKLVLPFFYSFDNWLCLHCNSMSSLRLVSCVVNMDLAF